LAAAPLPLSLFGSDKLKNKDMAVWQFDLQLMPNQVAADAPDCIDSAITEDGLDTTNWWLTNQPKDDYRRTIANAFSPLDSWCPETLRWGDEDKVLVEAFFSDGRLEGIGIRIDVRNIDLESIATMTQLAAKLDCQIYVMETQQIVTPDLDSFVPHLKKSKAAEFGLDPKEFIERPARQYAK
jgi:hypothetical protein